MDQSEDSRANEVTALDGLRWSQGPAVGQETDGEACRDAAWRGLLRLRPFQLVRAVNGVQHGGAKALSRRAQEVRSARIRATRALHLESRHSKAPTLAIIKPEQC